MITVASVYQASTHGPSPLPQSSIEFTQLPMGDNVVVANVNYADPQFERDLNLIFTPYLAFGAGTPFPHEVITGLIWELINFVQDQFVPRFHKWVPPTPRPANIPSGFARTI
jgi:hypothetical protein